MPMQIPFTQVDAFTTRPHAGNPAAVMPLEAWLPDATLLAIAAENNLSETAFTVPATGDADYELRWFTPTVEIAMCGHATLASGHVLMTGDAVRFRTRRAGILTVARDGDALTLDLPAIPVAPAQRPELLAALGTADAPVFVSTEGAQDRALVLLADEAAVRGCAPDMRALAALSIMAIVTAPGGGDKEGVTAPGGGDKEGVTAPGGGDKEGGTAPGTDIVSRVFVPAWGLDEDPVTGSAHAALAPFWAKRLGRETLTAYQASRRGGHLTCRLAGDRVILGGACVTVIEGKYRLNI